MTDPTRRTVLKQAAAVAAATTLSACRIEAVEDFIHTRLSEMTPERLARHIAELEADLEQRFGREVTVASTPARPGVVFGYGLDLNRCNGNRLCVDACIDENNQSRGSPDGEHDSRLAWITVLQMDDEHGLDLHHSTPYFDPEKVPEEGHFYLPVQCQHCSEPPCTDVCPVNATWKEPDGIVVIDYDQCVGCRCCMTACPYGARTFNWTEPNLPTAKLNPDLHVLGNVPRSKGVVEKCTFCIQRTREGRFPACHEACPTGARIFGNLLDPASPIRRLLETKRVFVLKAELNTKPSFFYFYG